VIEQETVLALIEVKENLDKVQDYLRQIERNLLRYAKPSDLPHHARNKLADAIGLIESILAQGR
jgi:hypothetical protein